MLNPIPALLVLVLGCSPSSQEGWLACEDPECRSHGVLEAFDRDPAAVVERLVELEPVEQETLVRELVRQRPEKASWICESMPEGSAGRDRCNRDLSRPHLTTGHQAKVAEVRLDRPAPGPWSRHPPVPETGGIPEEGQECSSRHPAGSLELQECLFRRAEALASERGIDAFPEVVSLCAASGTFATGCLHHSLAMSLPPAPPADAPGRDLVGRARASIDRVAQSLPDDVSGHYVDQAWAIWVAHAFRGADRVTGDLLEVLPPEAVPHVRMSAAWRLLRDRDPADLDLDALAAELEDALDETAGVPDAAPRRIAITLQKHRDFWPEDIGQREGAIPAVYCMGPGRRPFSPDPSLDARLALVEAAGRLSRPPPAAFFVDAAGLDRHEWVRWTAVRITADLHPGAALPEDPSRLVRGRRVRVP